MRNSPGDVRDSIFEYLATMESASISDIYDAVEARIGEVPPSSVRSSLNLNVPERIERVERGRYRLKLGDLPNNAQAKHEIFVSGKSRLVRANCLQWFREQEANSVHAVVTDPPYGLNEYSGIEQKKLRVGIGGIWRIPPAFDGHKRAPLPRFTILTASDRILLHDFFAEFGRLLRRVTVPGANVLIASNPLLGHIVASAMNDAGFENRGMIARLVMTMRGGDRPKNAHKEFSDISVMPRSMWEPWVVLRNPLDGRVQDNLRKWQTGGFRRVSEHKPFGDVIKSHPTSPRERQFAPHPSLKPQDFLRQLVRGVLPLGEGVVLDPFAGSGSTLAAANFIGYSSVGVESDEDYFRLARTAIPALTELIVRSPDL